MFPTTLLKSLFRLTIVFILIQAQLISFAATGSRPAVRPDDPKILKIKTTDEKKTLTKSSPLEVQITEPNDFSGILDIPECKNICIVEQPTAANNGTAVIKLDEKFFSTKDETKVVTLRYKLGNDVFETSLTVVIPARITKITKNEKPIEIVEGEEATLPGGYKYTLDGTEVKTDVTFEGDDLVEIKDQKVIAQKYGAGKITVLSTTATPAIIAEIPVKILPIVKTIELKSTAQITLTENTNAPLNIVLKGSDDQIVRDFSRVECKPDKPDFLSINKTVSGFVFAPKPVSGEKREIEITCNLIGTKKTNNDTSESLTFAVKVIPRDGYLTVENTTGTTLLPNGMLSFFIRLFDLTGKPVEGGIEYELDNQNDDQWVSLNKQGQKLEVNWVDLPVLDDQGKPKDKRPQFVKINIRANLSDGTKQISNSVTVHMAEVARFDSLKVKLNIMDERTASDLYGSVMNKEYYVLMVRLFNDLKSSEAKKFSGESILAYSSSIEIAVGLEKQYDRDSKNGTLTVLSKEQMETLQKSRSSKIFEDYKKNLKYLDSLYDEQLNQFNEQMKTAFAKDKIAQELELAATRDRNRADAARKARDEATQAFELAAATADKLNNIYEMNILSTPKTPTPDLPIADGKWYPATRNDLMQARMEESDVLSSARDDDFDSARSASDGEPTCIDTVTYRPFTFEMMVNSVDRRNERSPKSWVFKVLNFVGLAASTVTAIAVPGSSSDLPVGLDKYGNFFIPGLEKLVPNFKEQYRQNIVSQAMKPIEEIPFGSDITRVIFVPKKSIKGLITGHNARISQICPFYFRIKVAVISKGGDVTLGSQRR